MAIHHRADTLTTESFERLISSSPLRELIEESLEARKQISAKVAIFMRKNKEEADLFLSHASNPDLLLKVSKHFEDDRMRNFAELAWEMVNHHPDCDTTK